MKVHIIITSSNPHNFCEGEIYLKYGSKKHSGRAKVKVKSRSHLVNVDLHPPTNESTTFHLPTPYNFRNIAEHDFKGQGHYGKVTGEIKVTP